MARHAMNRGIAVAGSNSDIGAVEDGSAGAAVETASSATINSIRAIISSTSAISSRTNRPLPSYRIRMLRAGSTSHVTRAFSGSRKTVTSPRPAMRGFHQTSFVSLRFDAGISWWRARDAITGAG